MDRCVDRDNTSLFHFTWVVFNLTESDIDTINDTKIRLSVDLHDLADFSLFFSGVNEDLVSFDDLPATELGL